jgi:hypothetical protein
MRIKTCISIACFGIIGVVAGVHGVAQGNQTQQMSGLVNDYSAGGGGPWHVHADWNLRIKGDSGKADFSAAVAMVRSDLWVVLTSADPADTEARNPHTHHITLEDGDVTTLANGIRITGTATATGSGNPAFVSPLQIDITGGSAVPFSNISLTFSGAAASHYGTAPLNGVVSGR